MSDSKVSGSDCIYSSENSANFPSCTPPSEFRPLILGRFQLCKARFIPVEFREIRSKNRSKIRVTRINFLTRIRKFILVIDVIRWHIAAPPLETVCSDTPIFLHGALESLIRELSPLARALSCRNASGTTRTPHDITHTRDGLDPTEHAHHHALTCAHATHAPLHIRLSQGGSVARDSIHTTG